jgi:hypothetical protein
MGTTRPEAGPPGAERPEQDAAAREAESAAAPERAAPVSRGAPAPGGGAVDEPPKVSEELDRWLSGDGRKTVGGLIELFEEKSFALLFVLLLGVPALPLPTGGVTHVFEILAILLALQLIVGRHEIWVPRRWCELELAGPRQQKFLAGLMRFLRKLERFSKPRFRFLFNHRLTNVVFGLLVAAGSIAAFLAPPFTGLDTLPSLGVVLVSVGVLLEDIIVVAVGVTVGVAGVILEIVLGKAAVGGVKKLL